jgi:hypothetical protein
VLLVLELQKFCIKHPSWGADLLWKLPFCSWRCTNLDTWPAPLLESVRYCQHSSEFHDVILRLISKWVSHLMAGSCLQEVLATVCAENIVSHMLTMQTMSRAIKVTWWLLQLDVSLPAKNT